MKNFRLKSAFIYSMMLIVTLNMYAQTLVPKDSLTENNIENALRNLCK